jgi:hypothetical protein
MRKLALTLIVAGALFEAAVIAYWALNGAHFGWTQTYTVVEKTDPITGIQYPEKTPGFVPGVEILGLGIIIGTACSLCGVFLLRRQPR